METIRRNVFETNSSSVHTLTVRRLEPNNIPVSKTGKMRIKLGYFGKDVATEFDQLTKMSYVLTVTMVKLGLYDDGREGFKEHIETLQDNYIYDRIFDEVKEYVPDVKEIIPVYTPGYGLDHQMFNSIDYDIYDFIHMTVVDFVWGEGIGLHTTCD